jgi:hypothetical protein
LFHFRFVDDSHETVDEDEEMDQPKTPSYKKYWFLQKEIYFFVLLIFSFFNRGSKRVLQKDTPEL